MARRLEQLNEQLRSELAKLVNQEIILPDTLITISFVDCSPDLKQAKIAVSILPTRLTGSALEKLRKNSSRFSQSLKKKLKIRQIPRFNWLVDRTEENASQLDKIFKKIEKES